MFEIRTYVDEYMAGVIDLVLGIQQNEFNIQVDLHAQPDLLKIPEVYQKGKGNFWVALDGQVVGTIGLIDIGENTGVIRKMFVDKSHRGNQIGVSRQLMQILMQWAADRKIESLFLGTVDILLASHRFYEKNGFSRIAKEDLPVQFPLMNIDTRFYKYEFGTKNI